MLGRLILLLVQVIGGWFGANAIMSAIKFGEFRLFIFAVVASIVVFLIGVIAAQVLREVGAPGSPTLSRALTIAVIAALLWSFGPTLPLLKEIPWNKVPALYAVLGGAILGYHMKK